MHPLNAYLDESVHDDHGLYAIAAVLASPTLAPTAASTLRAALPDEEIPHWHGESPATRARLVAAVASLEVDARVYGCRFDSPRRAEAARARALGWFLVDVEETVGTIVLDRRQQRQNNKDKRVIESLSAAGRRMGYRHTPSSSEPLLRVADVVVGAVCATWLRGADYMPALKPVLSRCEREPE